MRWVSIAGIQASLDLATRAANQRQHMELCVMQAKLEQVERHHQEKCRSILKQCRYKHVH